MLQLIATFSLFSLLPYFSFAENKLPSGEFKSPPLSVFIQVDDNNKIVISNTERYIKSVDSQVSGSILSPQEMWNASREDSSKRESYRYIQLFHQWYFTELPIVILQKRGKFENKNDVIQPTEEKSFEDVSFLFNPREPVTAERLIAFASHYGYDNFEKLNLFLFALYKNIPEEELLKLLVEWNIARDIGVYIKDYKDYIGDFLEKFGENKDRVRSFISQLTLPFTSVLHELVEANRTILFHRMLGLPGLNVNIQNYLLQTVSHTALIKEWKIAQSYISALSKHPEVNFNLPDFRGWTPVFQAVDKADDLSFPAVRYLFEQKHRLDMDLLDEKRRTLTLLAAEQNKPELAKFLHENGAPFPQQVSLRNSYMTKDYKAVWFKYDTVVNLDPLMFLFDARADTPSFEVFQRMEVEKISPKERDVMWHYLRYYFLFQMLRDRLSDEESTRYVSISSLLFDEKTGEKTEKSEYRDVKEIIQAIYRGDTQTIDRIFSNNPEARDILQKPLFGNQYYAEDYWSQRTIREFDLLNRMNATVLPQNDSSLLFYSSMGSLLSEAIRSNQVESVQYLLDQGADPTFHERGFVIRDSMVTAILMGGVLYKYDEYYKDHLRIMDMLINHSSVTKSFLRGEVLPGINYADLAALTGHLQALKKMYRKGVSLSTEPVWQTGVSIEAFSYTSGFFLQTKFILEEQLRRDPNNREIQEQLNVCRRAFH